MSDNASESKRAGRVARGSCAEAHRAWPARIVRRVEAKIGSGLARHLDAEDALQDAWIALHSMHRGAPPTEIDAGLVVRACERRLLEVARYHSRREGAFANDVGETRIDEQLSVNATVDTLDASEQREIVRRHLQRLKLDHRKVLVLRHWFDTPWERIALALDRPTTHAAHTLHTRALQALATKLGCRASGTRI